MDCSICSTVPIKQLRELEREIRDGVATITTLAQKYGVDLDTLLAHSKNCVTLDTLDGYDQLESATRQLRVIGAALQQDINDGKHQQFDPEGGIDGRGTIGNYISVLREQRENIMAMRRLRSTDDTTKILTTDIINPVVTKLTQITIEEISRLRDVIFRLVPEQQHARVKTSTNEALTRIGDRLQNEATKDLDKKIEAALANKAVR